MKRGTGKNCDILYSLNSIFAFFLVYFSFSVLFSLDPETQCEQFKTLCDSLLKETCPTLMSLRSQSSLAEKLRTRLKVHIFEYEQK